jgi:bla regulator protein blaR1
MTSVVVCHVGIAPTVEEQALMSAWYAGYLFSNALVALAAGLLVLAWSRLWYRPALVHALWVVVLVKLFVPGVVLLPVPCYWEDAATTAAVERAVDGKPGEAAGQPRPPSDQPAVEATPSTSGVTALVSDADQPQSNPHQSMGGKRTGGTLGAGSVGRHFTLRTFTTVAMKAWPWLWLTGSVLLALQTLWGLSQLSQMLRSTRTSTELTELTIQLARRTGIEPAPEVVLSPHTGSPMLCGLGPWLRIVFPEQLWARLSPAARESLLLHELAHYRRRDHWVRVLECLATLVYWWHPVVWWARRELEHAEEQCCDAWVVSTIQDQPRTYAEALLSTLDFLAEKVPLKPSFATGLGDVPLLKLRLTQIIRRSVSPRNSPYALAGIGLLACLTLPCAPWPQAIAATAAGGGTGNAGVDIAALDRLARLSLPVVTAVRSSAVDEPFESSPSGATAAIGSPALSSDSSPLAATTPLEWWQAPTDSPWATVTSADHRYEVSASVVRGVVLRDRSRQTPIDLSRYRLSVVAFLPDGTEFVAGCRDGRVAVFSATTGQVVRWLGTHHGAVRALALTQDGQQVASGGADGLVLVRSVQIGFPSRSWRTPQELAVTALRYSEDGRRLLVAAGDWKSSSPAQLTIVDARSGQPMSQLALPHVSALLEVGMLDGTGETIASADYQGQMVHLNPVSGLAIEVGTIARSELIAAAFGATIDLLKRARTPGGQSSRYGVVSTQPVPMPQASTPAVATPAVATPPLRAQLLPTPRGPNPPVPTPPLRRTVPVPVVPPSLNDLPAAK